MLLIALSVKTRVAPSLTWVTPSRDLDRSFPGLDRSFPLTRGAHLPGSETLVLQDGALLLSTRSTLSVFGGTQTIGSSVAYPIVLPPG